MPGGLGYFGFGTGPLGGPITPAGVVPTTLVASWAIDPTTARYQLDPSGNPLGMDGTDQRVYWFVCQADTDVDVITPASLSAQAATLRGALRPLLTDGSITSLNVIAIDDGQARTLKTITYTNAGTNRAVTLKIR